MNKLFLKQCKSVIYEIFYHHLLFPFLETVVRTPHDAWCSIAPGHFYSPIPSKEDVANGKEQLLFPDSQNLPRKLAGIDLREDEQFAILKQLLQFYAELPFPDIQTSEFRYWYLNDTYSYTDAIFLYSIIRDRKPKRIIEIGCGKTTALMLDVNERYFNYGIKYIGIEPYPEYLYECIRENDIEKIEIIEKKVQDVDVEIFRNLGCDDILFIDCSHVVKFNSDLVHIFNNILPILEKGVLIHFHDIFYPFEIPSSWIDQGRYWNEAYFLKNFLAYNSEFQIYLFATFLHAFYHEWLSQNMPLSLKSQGGNIWIKRV